MKKDDDEKEAGQRKSALAEMMPVIRSICGANEADRAIKDDSKDEKPGLGPFFKRLLNEAKELEKAKNRQEIQILNGLKYPGEKRIH